jgi:hypothetical protein
MSGRKQTSFSDSEDGGAYFLRNVGRLLTSYTVLSPEARSLHSDARHSTKHAFTPSRLHAFTPSRSLVLKVTAQPRRNFGDLHKVKLRSDVQRESLPGLGVVCMESLLSLGVVCVESLLSLGVVCMESLPNPGVV